VFRSPIIKPILDEGKTREILHLSIVHQEDTIAKSECQQWYRMINEQITRIIHTVAVVH
jgi:hypothetical protein